MKLKLLSIGALLLFFMGTTDNTYQIEDVVEDFTLKSVSGKQITLSEYADNGAIIVFDCNTCPYSKAYLERIKALHAKYSSKGFPVLAINPNDPKRSPDDSFENMVQYAKDNNYEHAYVQDVDQIVAKAFGASNTPHVFVVFNSNNNFILKYIGAIDNNTRDADAADKKYVEDAVDALLTGKDPSVNKTKAIGCTIKWSM